MNDRRLIVPLAAVLSLAGSGLALSAAGEPAAAYPNRPLRVIVPFPPGGGADTVARLLAERLTETVGQQIVIDNRGGASTIIGAELAARATPDGYTVLFSPNQLAINPLVFPKLPYDPQRDFAPVARVATSALIVVVNPALEARSVEQLIALAKAKPGGLNLASSGNYGPPHLAGELFMSLTGVKMVHVPYKGAGLALPALIGGQVHVMFATMPSALPHVRSGRLRAFAVTSPKRAGVAPELPAVAETVPGFETTVWYAMVVPARTPRAIVSRLNSAVNRVLERADFRRALAASGAEPAPGTPEELGSFIRAERKRWKKVLDAINRGGK